MIIVLFHLSLERSSEALLKVSFIPLEQKQRQETFYISNDATCLVKTSSDWIPSTMSNSTDSLETDENDAGDITRYYCEMTMANNPNLMKIYIPYAYELLYNCSYGSGQGMAAIELSVLYKLHKKWLETADMCTSPQTIWLAALSSFPVDDRVNSDCTSFNTSSTPEMCCDVIQGNLTLTNLSSVDEDMNDILEEVSKALMSSNSGAYQVDYLGADLRDSPSTGSDNIAASINSDTPEVLPEDGEMTLLGIFVILFLIITACCVFLLIWQRQRRARELLFAFSKSDDESGFEMDEDDYDEYEDEEEWIEPRRVPRREPVDPKALNGGDDSLDIYIRSIASHSFEDPAEQSNENERTPMPPSRKSNSGAYCFDPVETQEVQHRQQRTALVPPTSGRQPARYSQNPYAYSIGGISVVPAYAHEVEASDNSEIDSWAQTEGTIGSLEEERELRDSGY